MKDSKLVQRVKNELGIDVDKQIRKEIEKTKHPHVDVHQLGKIYEAKANRLLERERSISMAINNAFCQNNIN